MGRITLTGRMATMSTAIIMAGVGLTGIASAETITNTGPYSTNSIRNNITNKCSVENDNDVNVKNSNDQKATSGDATVGSSGHDWSDPDPVFIQAGSDGNGWGGSNSSSLGSINDPSSDGSFGDSPSFLDGSNGNWPKDPGGGNTIGGDAASGDATNNNSTNLSVDIDNSVGNPCIQNNIKVKKHVASAKIVKPSISSKAKVSVIPGAPGVPGAGAGIGAGQPVGGFGAAGVPAVSKRVTPSISAAAVAAAGRGAAVAAVAPQKSVISVTGPNSSNVISSNVSNKTSVTNNNNICITNTNSQKASTGDATVSGNTSAGSGETGDAGNGNSTGVGADLAN